MNCKRCKSVLGVVVLGVGLLLVYFGLLRNDQPNSVSLETPTPYETVSLSPSPVSSPWPSPSVGQVAAACQIKGEIIFLNKSIYENKGATIAYQNVDDVIRQIYWKSEPDDGVLTVGPNLFEDLPLPNSEINVGVALTKETAAKNYTLTASITYGTKNARGLVEEKIANCVGKVSVDTSRI